MDYLIPIFARTSSNQYETTTREGRPAGGAALTDLIIRNRVPSRDSLTSKFRATLGKYPPAEISGTGLLYLKLGVVATGTDIIMESGAPEMKNNSRPFRAQSGNAPPVDEGIFQPEDSIAGNG